MTVYRITLAQYAKALQASGSAARWNINDVKVIYTAGSRALACLENVVHRSSRGLQGIFRTLIIEVPDSMKIIIIDQKALHPQWQHYAGMPYTQQIGDKWVHDGSSAVLRVPSVIIPEEHNFIINPAHRDFSKIKLVASEPFEFDTRIKEQ